ncbi:MAG TPA: hypothetical protein ENN14_00145, partial [Chloroflexi bacterium]|nr:hypothetical protein [Chloroflexota bacterium]
MTRSKIYAYAMLAVCALSAALLLKPPPATVSRAAESSDITATLTIAPQPVARYGLITATATLHNPDWIAHPFTLTYQTVGLFPRSALAAGLLEPGATFTHTWRATALLTPTVAATLRVWQGDIALPEQTQTSPVAGIAPTRPLTQPALITGTMALTPTAVRRDQPLIITYTVRNLDDLQPRDFAVAITLVGGYPTEFTLAGRLQPDEARIYTLEARTTHGAAVTATLTLYSEGYAQFTHQRTAPFIEHKLFIPLLMR